MTGYERKSSKSFILVKGKKVIFTERKDGKHEKIEKNNKKQP